MKTDRIVYSSRSVRVVLAQGPCLSSLHRSNVWSESGCLYIYIYIYIYVYIHTHVSYLMLMYLFVCMLIFSASLQCLKRIRVPPVGCPGLGFSRLKLVWMNKFLFRNNCLRLFSLLANNVISYSYTFSNRWSPKGIQLRKGHKPSTLNPIYIYVYIPTHTYIYIYISLFVCLCIYLFMHGWGRGI